jgi:hypothetical protein
LLPQNRVLVKTFLSLGRDTRRGVNTRVNFPAGGYLVVKKSESGLDNFVDVHGHLNDLKYWYRCGVDEPRVNY